MADRLLVSGGAQRDAASRLGEGHRYHKASLIEVDFDTGKTKLVLSIDQQNKHYPDELPNITFTSCALKGDILYICTETEVFTYEYPGLKLQKKVSYPFFQNCHHVSPVAEYVAVVSTGLDLVVYLDPVTFEPVQFKNTLGKDPWYRFSKEVDYRKVHSTKPHESHPNYVFELNGEVWVTRFNQKDAVCLDNLERKIELGVERVHDGHIVGKNIYFTAVDGRIIVVDQDSMSVRSIVNLNEVESSGQPLGWCRGLLVEDNIAYVAFTRIRQTSVKENVKWLLSCVGRSNALPTRIVKYDLEEKTKLGEMVMPVGTVDAIYSVLRVPQ